MNPSAFDLRVLAEVGEGIARVRLPVSDRDLADMERRGLVRVRRPGGPTAATVCPGPNAPARPRRAVGPGDREELARRAAADLPELLALPHPEPRHSAAWARELAAAEALGFAPGAGDPEAAAAADAAQAAYGNALDAALRAAGEPPIRAALP